jgi:hypothetical protein
MIHKTVIILLAITSVGVGGAWIASHFTAVGGFWELNETWSFTYGVRAGHATCFVTHYRPAPTQKAFFACWWSFGAYSYDKRGFLHSGLSFPLWGLLALLAVYPIVAFSRGPLRRRRRRGRGLCIRCGYDLKGNVSGVCPECGETIHKDDLRE